MKRLISIILLSIPLTAFSQRNSGVKFGTQLSWIASTKTSVPQFNDNFNITPLLSFHIGYSWNIPLTNKLSLQTELLYDRKGWELECTNPSYYTSVVFDPNTVVFDPNTGTNNSYYVPEFTKRDYWNLPLSINYMIQKNIFIEIGGEVSATLSYANLIDYAIITGTGYCTKYADFSIRYIHGIANSNPSVNNRSEIDKNRTLQLSLTIPIFKYFKRKE